MSKLIDSALAMHNDATHTRPVRTFWSVLARPAVGASGREDQPLMESYMKTLLKNLIRDEQGQDVIEYALLAAAISIAVVPTVPGLGTAVNAIYVRVQAALP